MRAHAALLACVPLWGLQAGCGDSPPLNLILISVDTLRADRLGCYGYARDTSPAIDRFAGGAVLFRQTIAESPWTLPSHYTMLTGLHPERHRGA